MSACWIERALDLEDGGLRARRLSRPLRGGDAEHGRLERQKIDLDGGDLGAELGVLAEGTAVAHLLSGDPLELGQEPRGEADAGDAGALVRQEIFGISPALALLADEVRLGHAHIVEEDRVDLRTAVNGDDRRHRDAGAPHVHEEEGDAFLLLARTSAVRTKQKIMSAYCA